MRVADRLSLSSWRSAAQGWWVESAVEKLPLWWQVHGGAEWGPQVPRHQGDQPHQQPHQVVRCGNPASHRFANQQDRGHEFQQDRLVGMPAVGQGAAVEGVSRRTTHPGGQLSWW